MENATALMVEKILYFIEVALLLGVTGFVLYKFYFKFDHENETSETPERHL